ARGWGWVSGTPPRHPAALALGAEDEHEAVVFPGLDEHLDAGQLDAPEPLGQAQVQLGGGPARGPGRDTAHAVHSAEVPAGRDVPRAKLELDAERLEHAAAHLILEGIVAEETEMAGAAARGDPGRDVADEAAGGLGGEL